MNFQLHENESFLCVSASCNVFPRPVCWALGKNASICEKKKTTSFFERKRKIRHFQNERKGKIARLLMVYLKSRKYRAYGTSEGYVMIREGAF